MMHLNKHWVSWFTGFSEGDGHFGINGNALFFVLTQKEKAILEEIQQILGFGNLTFDASVNCWRFKVHGIENIFKLAQIFNGNLVLDHRIAQFNSWIKILNSKGYKIELLGKSKLTLENAWLSGFTDAEGCFTITASGENAKRQRVKMRFLIDQNDEQVLLAIRDLLETGFVSFRKSTASCYRLTAESFGKLDSIVNYFKAFPLRTKKLNSFNKWLEVRVKMLNNEHLIPGGIAKIKELASKINKE
uniref:LAGLIDADG endonuclease n=1 Tax=Coniophora puteana TaxID=80637 RepID=A0A896YYP9_9AGAM